MQRDIKPLYNSRAMQNTDRSLRRNTFCKCIQVINIEKRFIVAKVYASFINYLINNIYYNVRINRYTNAIASAIETLNQI